MNKKSSTFRFLNKVYKILICILAPICFLFAPYYYIYSIVDFGYKGLLTAPIGTIIFLTELFSEIDAWMVLTLVLLCTFISQKFIHTIWPKLSSKKVLFFCFIYYFLMASAMRALFAIWASC